MIEWESEKKINELRVKKRNNSMAFKKAFINLIKKTIREDWKGKIRILKYLPTHSSRERAVFPVPGGATSKKIPQLTAAMFQKVEWRINFES